MSHGWIKLYRALTRHWLWEDRPFARGQAFIDLLLMVNHEEKSFPFDGGTGRTGKGSMITSIRKLAQRWGWSRKKVSTFLDELARDGMLVKQSDTKKTVLTIKNYSRYQAKADRIAKEEPAEEPPPPTNKREKKASDPVTGPEARLASRISELRR